jgi:hypothetical protein
MSVITISVSSAVNFQQDEELESATNIGGSEISENRVQSGQPVEVIYRFNRLPDTTGRMAVQVEVNLPPSITRFKMAIGDMGTIQEMNGFEQKTGEYKWRWTQSERTPTITYSIETDKVNQEAGFPIILDSQSWSLASIEHPDVAFRYRYEGVETDPGWAERIALQDKQGFAGGHMALLGSSTEVFQKRLGEQTLNLVIPDVTQKNGLDQSRTKIVQTISAAAADFQVGARDSTLNLIVTTDPLREGSGYTIKNNRREYRDTPDDFWVHQGSKINSPTNAWVHEYIHTRQEFVLSREMQWLDEATATYYAGYLTWEQGRISYSTFAEYFRMEDDAEAQLIRPSSWQTSGVGYTKGSRVIAGLDAKIRQETDGRKSFEDVFRRLNSQRNEITYFTFKQLIADVVGRDLGGWLDQFVSKANVPKIPGTAQLFKGGSQENQQKEKGNSGDNTNHTGQEKGGNTKNENRDTPSGTAVEETSQGKIKFKDCTTVRITGNFENVVISWSAYIPGPVVNRAIKGPLSGSETFTFPKFVTENYIKKDQVVIDSVQAYDGSISGEPALHKKNPNWDACTQRAKSN